MSSMSAAANASSSSGGTSRPSSPSVMTCRGPVGQSKLTTGRCLLIASSRTIGRPSNRELSAKIDALDSSAARSSTGPTSSTRSEEHTSELQSRQYLVCRLLLEKKTIIALLTHHYQLALFQEHPDLVPRSVEALLRFDGSVPVASPIIAHNHVAYRGSSIQLG